MAIDKSVNRRNNGDMARITPRRWFMLWHYRCWAQLDQKSAASRSGLSTSAWSLYEGGHRPVPKRANVIQALARAVATPQTDAEIKFEMLCRSVGYIDLLPSPHRALAGLPQYVLPEAEAWPLAFQPGRWTEYSKLRLLKAAADLGGERIQRAGFSPADVRSRFEAVVSEAFGIEILNRRVDDAFSAFYYPSTSTIEVNPDLTEPERRHAIAHELAHYLIERASRNRSDAREFALDALFGCNFFENVAGERGVNSLACLILLPELPSEIQEGRTTADVIREVAETNGVPPEVVLCRAYLHQAFGEETVLSPHEASSLGRQFPLTTFYW